MGKSSAGRYLQSKGLPIFNADEVVHELYGGEAVASVEATFPGTTTEGKVDRELLVKQLIGRPDQLAKLEALIHPLVEKKRLSFIEYHRALGTKSIILDIPLLFEKQLEDTVDTILLVTAPADVQVQRVMARPNMTIEKFDMIRSLQMDDAEKRTRSDFVVDTSGSFEETYAKLDQFLESVQDGFSG